jgi:biotin carboxyl carrier protein
MTVNATNHLLELALDEKDGVQRLRSPTVGLFTRPVPPGQTLTPGQDAGTITTLSRSFVLVVPAGVSGVVTTKRRERVRAPVAFGEVLYELEPLAKSIGGRTDAKSTTRAAKSGEPMALRSPQSGRFYHRAAPGEPAFIAVGQIVEEGRPIGLIEVMKTFTHVVYRAASGLPARAKVVRIAAPDGGEVRAGDVLLELEPG